MTDDLQPLTADELAAEGVTALPDKEVISLLDLNADLDLALDVAAPVDLAVAANANIAAPIDAAVAANVLSLDSSATSLSDQSVLIDQGISGEAIANAPQDSAIDQGADSPAVDQPVDQPAAAADGGATTGGLLSDPASALDGDLLNVDVKLAADADITAPVAGAVAANANVAAPIDAAVAANVGSIGSEAVAVSDQDAVISQQLDDVTAEATADQTSTIEQ